MVKELKNTLIDFKRNSKESSRKPFKSLKKKINNPRLQEAKGMTFEEETMDVWCFAHISKH